MASLVLKDVTYRFENGVEVPRRISFEVSEKNFLVLVGPSGCGKSTTLRLVSGLAEPAEGEIFIAERKVNHLPPKEREVAMVFQNYALYPHMTVFENIAFGLKLKKTPKNEIDAKVRKTADFLGLSALLERKPKALSGGERQRVALGRALVREPKVLLLDEPLSNLDAALRQRVRQELLGLKKELNAATVYVTHDQTEAMSLGDKIGVMKSGELLQIGTPEQIYTDPQTLFVAQFFGHPGMNALASAGASNGALNFPSWNLPLPSSLLGKVGQSAKPTVGFRPEKGKFSAPSQNNALKLPVKFLAEENFGHELFYYLETPDGQKLSVRTVEKAGRAPEAVYLHPDDLYFFDFQTGKRI
ncbi:MAG: ABC transporter ATP-binding protein [candidate division Zixibacteria bacterium]|nr:ABC transporter ATP-binding protein [candidate division Zixibacteria bacterium]